MSSIKTGHSLVVEDDIRQPDDLRGHVDLAHPAILLGVPAQLVVVPLLQEGGNK